MVLSQSHERQHAVRVHLYSKLHCQTLTALCAETEVFAADQVIP